jgi:nitrogen fixation/metabolism regulation signal transduction histidine kinase
VMGSRLTLRLLGTFALMAIIPGLIVYLVSVNFLTRSIESWFNVKVESALDGGLSLGQRALDIMLADIEEKAENMATSLAFQPSKSHYSLLNDLREKSGIQDAVLLTPQGRISYPVLVSCVKPKRGCMGKLSRFRIKACICVC